MNILHQSNSSLVVEAKFPKNWFFIAFAGFWLMGWLMGMIFVIGTLFFGDTQEPFLYLWLAGWTLGGSFLLVMLLSMLTGKERLDANTSRVIISRRVLFYHKVYELPTRQIVRVVINHGQATMELMLRNSMMVIFSAMNRKGGKVQLDYQMKTYGFGTGIEDAEARHIIELLEKIGIGRK